MKSRRRRLVEVNCGSNLCNSRVRNYLCANQQQQASKHFSFAALQVPFSFIGRGSTRKKHTTARDFRWKIFSEWKKKRSALPLTQAMYFDARVEINSIVGRVWVCFSTKIDSHQRDENKAEIIVKHSQLADFTARALIRPPRAIISWFNEFTLENIHNWEKKNSFIHLLCIFLEFIVALITHPKMKTSLSNVKYQMIFTSAVSVIKTLFLSLAPPSQSNSRSRSRREVQFWRHTRSTVWLAQGLQLFFFSSRLSVRAS